jgi:hypothetical protein
MLNLKNIFILYALGYKNNVQSLLAVFSPAKVRTQLKVIKLMLDFAA